MFTSCLLLIIFEIMKSLWKTDCVCVFARLCLYLLRTEYQTSHSTNKVGTFLQLIRTVKMWFLGLRLKMVFLLGLGLGVGVNLDG